MNKLLSFLKSHWADFLVVLLFLVISTAYFFTPWSEGQELAGHDSIAAIGQGHEQLQYREQTGETSRWTNSMFSGMPTYQISPSYGSSSVLTTISRVMHLGTTGPIGYLLLYLLGFYILMRAMGKKPWLSTVGAVAWAFSSYFLIIIAAGHIWKVDTLGFIPPTIAGLILCYRGRLWLGGAVTALFTALQILCNHIQMSYYFCYLMLFIVLCTLVYALKDKAQRAEDLKQWGKATGVIIAAGLLGIAANLPNLYHTYTYSKETMRGKSELTVKNDNANENDNQARSKATDGLTREYITQWSYGIDETATLLVPDFKGGGSGSIVDYQSGQIKEEWQERPGFNDFFNNVFPAQEALQGCKEPGASLPGIMTYWGDQPMTMGPVYVGAFLLFLFVLGAFIVRGPIKWALVLATCLSLLMAWGKNLMPVTDFFIDFLPMYSKFRTVSSALVVLEFTVPVLAVLALSEIITRPAKALIAEKEFKVGLGFATAFTIVPCVVLFVWQGSVFSADEMVAVEYLRGVMPADQLQTYLHGVASMRGSVVSASALRSLLIILIGVAMVLGYWKKLYGEKVLCILVAALCLGDLWMEDKKYLNDESFSDSLTISDQFIQETPADKYILSDKDPYYRVMNLATSTFNETSNRTSYRHHSIGGYSAVKLQRYQDLIDHHLSAEAVALQSAFQQCVSDTLNTYIPEDTADPYRCLMELLPCDSLTPVLNMLNCKYYIIANEQVALPNPAANGNAWFVEGLRLVDNADQEIVALRGLDTKHQAVADKRFASVLEGKFGTGSATLTQYAPNELHYKVSAQGDGLLVFSEIYYPGWTAKVDGQEVELGRVNYVLRAMRVPSGEHEVVLEFRPASVTTTDGIAYAAIALILMALCFAIYKTYKRV